MFRNKMFNLILHFKITGLYLYMLVVETFTGENIKLRVYVIIGWGKVTFNCLITVFLIL
jgi:corticotropin releasing hormone receptor 1